MLRLNVGGTDLDLSANATIEWVRINPLFEDDVDLKVDHSFNFKITRTRLNERVLGTSCLSLPATLYVEGRLWAIGNLHILRHLEGGWDVSVTTSLLLNEGIDRLRDLVFEDIAVDVPTVFDLKDDVNTKDYPATNFVFPWIWNQSEDARQRLTNITTTPGIYVNEESMNSGNTDRTDLLSPQFFLKYIIKASAEQATGLEADGKLFELIDEYLIYNNVAIYSPGCLEVETDVIVGTNSPTRVAFCITDIECFSPQVGDSLIAIIDGLDLGGNYVQFNVDYTFQLSDVPAVVIDVNAFFDNLEAYLISLNMDIGNSSRNLLLGCYYFNGSVDVNEPSHKFSVVQSVINAYNPIRTANHLPDTSISEFWNALKDFFCLSIAPDYSKKKLVFTPRKCLLQTSEYKDYTSKHLDYDELTCGDANPLRFVYNNDTTDECTKDISVYRWHANNHPEHVQEGYKEVPISASSTDVANVVVGIDMAFNPITEPLVKVNQPMQDYDTLGSKEFTLRFIRWEGLTDWEGNLPALAPWADNNGLTPNSAYTEWWREWYQGIKDGKHLHRFPMCLTAADVRELDPRLKWRIGSHMYLWKEIRTPINMQFGVQPSTVDLLKVEYERGCAGTTVEEEVPPPE